jgi:hypothetical protein
MTTEDDWRRLNKDYRDNGIALALGSGVSVACQLPNWREMGHGLEGHPAIPWGDDSCDRCLRATCTLKCPRLPVSPPSLTAHFA